MYNDGRVPIYINRVTRVKTYSIFQLFGDYRKMTTESSIV